MKSLFPRILVLFACIFLVPELSHAVEKWHNPEGSGARVVQGQAFFSKIISGGGTSTIGFPRLLRARYVQMKIR